MAMRITGMNSGLDTESLIQDLVKAKRTKVDSQKKAQTKHQWKQDAWKELNTKLKNLQSKYLSTMRFSDSYSKKTTKVSNSSAVSVLTGAGAVNGVQSLEIQQLAKTGYLTGAKIQGNDGKLTALSKMSELTDAQGNAIFSGEGTFSVKTGEKNVDIKVTADTTISDVLTQIKSAGLNANFDAGQQRLFISAKESGLDNDFSITASDLSGSKALQALGIQTDLNSDKVTSAEYDKYASMYVAGNRGATLTNLKSLIDKDVATKVSTYLDQYKSLKSSMKSAQDKIDELNKKYENDPLKSVDEYKTELEEKQKEITDAEEALKNITDPDEKKRVEEKITELKKEADAIKTKQSDAETVNKQKENLTKYESDIAKIEENISVTDNGDGTYSAEKTTKLQEEVENAFYAKAEYAAGVKDGSIALASTGATKVSGQDAIIKLNDATFTSTGNSFEINGLTFTALAETKPSEAITVTTEQDTNGIYDMVKNFLKEYNSLVNEMDKLYNADAAKGYEPLLDEEKDAMSETEVKDWEKKIKDALLHRDDNLSTVNSSLQSIMASGIEINGKTMYLHDFGIDMLSYFSAPDNEKHMYHIDGDPDDGATSGNADKLKGMIASDPDTVINFFTKLSQSIYDKMTDLSKSVTGYRTFGNFYDNTRLQSEYDNYKSKIVDLEEKLTEYEDKWYAKFSKMETALAKMQSNANSITSLLGG